MQHTVFPALPALALALVLTSVGQADVVHLDDGSEVIGVTLGQENGRLHVYTDDGTVELELARVVEVDREHELDDDTVRRRGARAQRSFYQRREREARRILRGYGRTDDPAERAALVAQLDDFGAPELIEAASSYLDDRDEEVRELAIETLAGARTDEVRERVFPLLREVLTTKYDDVVEKGHHAALALDPDLTRRVYEAVAQSGTLPGRRINALRQLGRMGVRDSVPGLVLVIERVNQQIRASMATAGELRQVPLNLGNGSGAGTNVPVELPEMQFVEVGTNSSVSIAHLERVRAGAASVLSSVTGEDFGDDAALWRQWWEREGSRVNDGRQR
jgi:HEAT repeats